LSDKYDELSKKFDAIDHLLDKEKIEKLTDKKESEAKSDKK